MLNQAGFILLESTKYNITRQPAEGGPQIFLKTGRGRDCSRPLRFGVSSLQQFQRLVWKRALEQAGIAYRKPYTTRHTFAAWSLTLGTDPNRLVSLMGHASKQMVYEVYGKYTEGLEEDREDILGYFGHDFLTRGKQKEEGAKVFCESSVPVDESYWYCGA